MTILAVTLFVFWKIFKRTKFIKPHHVDLVWERPIIDAFEASTTDSMNSFWEEMGHLVFIRRHKSDFQRELGN
jgi:amino acid transporter